MNKGIDYSIGTANRDNENGIHYGVISQNEVLQAWADNSEPYCPCEDCGDWDLAQEDDTGSWFVVDVDNKNVAGPFDNEEEARDYVDDNKSDICGCDFCEPSSFYVDDEEYKAEQSRDDTDIFILKSPYYTRCQYCSPCAPGAGYVMNTVPDGIKAYCFGHDWFEDGKAPYPVYRVDNDERV